MIEAEVSRDFTRNTMCSLRGSSVVENGCQFEEVIWVGVLLDDNPCYFCMHAIS